MKAIRKRAFVKPFVDNNECECGGEMKATGVCYEAMPTQHEYKCEDCGKVVVKTATSTNEEIATIIKEATEE